MIDPVLFPLFAKAFVQVAGPLLRKAAEKHVESFFGSALERLAGIGRPDLVVDARPAGHAPAPSHSDMTWEHRQGLLHTLLQRPR